MTWYFGYGANMWARVMQIRGIEFTIRERAWLDGWRRVFTNITTSQPGQGYATVIPDPEYCLEGILYFCPKGLARLDEFEGVAMRHYERVSLPVRRENGQFVQAEVYVAPQDTVMDGLKPSREYINKLLGGRDLLSETAIKEIESVEVWSPYE